MLLFPKTVHVLALGLCFGTGIFFTFVVALSLLQTYEALAAPAAAARQPWFPVPPELERDPPSTKFPNPLRKEQGSRVFGAGVGSIFAYYYLIQLGGAALALMTALTCLGAGRRRVDVVRVVVLVLALAGAGVGTWLDGVVSKLRDERSAKSDAVLFHGHPEVLAEADAAREQFGRWHFYSLLANFATVLFVTVAMALAAQLPASVVQAAPPVRQTAAAHPD
jgi:hypothetical protein